MAHELLWGVGGNCACDPGGVGARGLQLPAVGRMPRPGVPLHGWPMTPSVVHASCPKCGKIPIKTLTWRLCDGKQSVQAYGPWGALSSARCGRSYLIILDGFRF